MKKKFINSKTLMEDYWISHNHANLIIKKLLNEWLIIKLNVSNYIFKHALDYFNNFEIAMIMDNSCYIWIYNVLERKIIKQAHTKTFALSNNRITKNNDILSLKNIEFINIKIPLTFWIEYKNNIRYSDLERSLLDLIYLHIFAKMPITSELYLSWNINHDKIVEYLQYYPIHVSNFYFNKLQSYAK